MQPNPDILLLGCDPALDILTCLLRRKLPAASARSFFASSKRALQAPAAGTADVAGTHFHSTGGAEANVGAVRALLPGKDCRIIAFSLQE